MRDASINMSEKDNLWKFIKAQVEIFLGKLVTGKSSNDTLIDQYSDKVLWQNIDRIKGKHAAEIGRKEFFFTTDNYYALLQKRKFAWMNTISSKG